MTDAERLAAYDRMYADLLRERDKLAADKIGRAHV